MRQPKGWEHFTANRSTTVLTEAVRIFIEFTPHDYKTATLVTVGTYAALRAVKLCLYDCGVVLNNNKQRVHDFFLNADDKGFEAEAHSAVRRCERWEPGQYFD